MYLRKRAADGPFEVYTDTASKIALYRRIRAMFAWALLVVGMCSASAWSLLFRFPEDMGARGLAGLYVVMIAVMLRAVWHCSWKIKELERQDR